jgi:MFS family permease
VSQGVSNPGLFFGAYAIVLILARGLGGGIIDLYSRKRILLPCLASYVIGMMVLAFSKTLPMFIVVADHRGWARFHALPDGYAHSWVPGAGDGHHIAMLIWDEVGPVLMGLFSGGTWVMFWPGYHQPHRFLLLSSTREGRVIRPCSETPGKDGRLTGLHNLRSSDPQPCPRGVSMIREGA